VVGVPVEPWAVALVDGDTLAAVAEVVGDAVRLGVWELDGRVLVADPVAVEVADAVAVAVAVATAVAVAAADVLLVAGAGVWGTTISV